MFRIYYTKKRVKVKLRAVVNEDLLYDKKTYREEKISDTCGKTLKKNQKIENGNLNDLE